MIPESILLWEKEKKTRIVDGIKKTFLMAEATLNFKLSYTNKKS